MKDEKQRTRERLTAFLRDEVFKDKDLDDLSSLAGFIASKGNDFIVSFCEWLELGEWFIEELDDCEFNVDEFLSDLRHDWEKEAEETSKEQYETMLDRQRIQGWPY
jgi:hypothetical protein